MIAQRHILGTFDEALASLRNNVLMMSSLTERSLERAIKGLFEQAMSMFKDSVDAFVREDVDLGRAVVTRDEKLDELNHSASRKLIERMANDREQLRGYLNLIFIGRCLERLGDHATNIAEEAVYAAAAEDIRHPSLSATTSGG